MVWDMNTGSFVSNDFSGPTYKNTFMSSKAMTLAVIK